MAKLILIFLLSASSAHADLFDFGGEKTRESKVTKLTEKLDKLELKDDPGFEEKFNESVKTLENAVEEEKLYCSGEVADAKGKTLPAAQKQLCMRELKKHYLEAVKTIFEKKKKYLELIHQSQARKLSTIEKKLIEDIDKNF